MASDDLEENATNDVPIPQPLVRLNKCLVRPYHHSDAEAISEAANNPDIVKYMTNAFPHPYTLESADAWFRLCWAENPPRNFAICDLSNKPIGGIGLKPGSDVEIRSTEIGYWVGVPSWGKGIMSDAVKGFTDWVFREREDIQRIWAGVFEGNVASERVLQRAGYTFEGTMRKMIWKNQKLCDKNVWAIIRDDWENLERT